jgi:tetratricopeptide (TPR) repeat protein
VDEARRGSEGDQKFKEAVTTAGQMLLHVREYPSAAALLEAGASGSNTARTMGLVSILGKVKKHEALKFGDTPEDLVRQFMLTAMRSPVSLDAFNVFESHNSLLVSRALTREEREEQERELRGYLNLVKRTGLPADVMSDVALQAMQIKSSGDDGVGYRETLQVPNIPNETYYVVKEDGHYKMLDSGSTPVALALEVLERVQRQGLAGASMMLRWVREVVPNDKSDDPDGGNPFLRLWASGQQQADAHTITLASAALLVQKRATAERGITLLEQAAAAGPGDAEAENIDVALLLGYEQLRRHDRALAIATRLMARNQQSKRVFHALSTQLRALNRFKEADDLAASRLQKAPGDVDALRSLAHTFAAQHDYAHAYEERLKVVASANSVTGDTNDLAWRSLFFDRAGGPDLETAVRATQLEANNSRMLHTLACIYAEVGTTREAREVLLQAMEARKLVEPESVYWYAFGRIAEQYGERDIALADYVKVTRPLDSSLEYDSTYRLAQIRMKALGARGL